MRYLRLLSVFYRTSIQTDMEYRADFFGRIIASLLSLVTTIGSLSIAFNFTTTLQGWSYGKAMVVLAVYYVMDGLIELVIAPNMRQVMTQVREGTLDFVLIKPVSAQFMASFRTVSIWRIANICVGLGLAGYTVNRLAVQTGPAQALAFAMTLVCGMMIVYSVWLVLVTLTFWFVRIDNIEQVMWQAFEAGRYPVDIYPTWLRGALTYALPVVFMITVPAQALSGSATPTMLVTAPCLAVASVLAASAFWRFGLRFYTGASA